MLFRRKQYLWPREILMLEIFALNGGLMCIDTGYIYNDICIIIILNDALHAFGFFKSF